VPINVDRLQMVMCAIERLASHNKFLASAEGEAPLPSCLRLSDIGKEDELTAAPRRCEEGMTPGWVIAVLGEPVDDDYLEDGDSIVLLTKMAVNMAREDTLTSRAWRHFSELMNVYAEFVDQNLELPSLPGFFGGKRRRSSARRSSAGGSRRQSIVSVQEVDMASNHYEEADAALLRAMSDAPRVDTLWLRLHQSCCPLLMEALLQHAATVKYGSEPGGGDELAASLLWKLCGWDSPSGRRLIRRLFRVFDRYAQAGGGGLVLTQSGFLKLCTDGGLTSSRDKDYSGFQHLFASAVAQTSQNSAHFLAFLSIVEEMLTFLQCKVKTQGLQVWQMLEAAMTRISSAGGHTSKTASTVKSKAQPAAAKRRDTAKADTFLKQNLLGERASPDSSRSRGRADAASPTPSSPRRGGRASMSPNALGEPAPPTFLVEAGQPVRGPADCGVLGDDDGQENDAMPPPDGHGWGGAD